MISQRTFKIKQPNDRGCVPKAELLACALLQSSGPTADATAGQQLVNGWVHPLTSIWHRQVGSVRFTGAHVAQTAQKHGAAHHNWQQAPGSHQN